MWVVRICLFSLRRPHITWFIVTVEIDFISVWGIEPGVDFSVAIVINLCFAWVVEIDLVVVWMVENDLIFVCRPIITFFLCKRRN